MKGWGLKVDGAEAVKNSYPPSPGIYAQTYPYQGGYVLLCLYSLLTPIREGMSSSVYTQGGYVLLCLYSPLSGRVCPLSILKLHPYQGGYVLLYLYSPLSGRVCPPLSILTPIREGMSSSVYTHPYQGGYVLLCLYSNLPLSGRVCPPLSILTPAMCVKYTSAPVNWDPRQKLNVISALS